MTQAVTARREGDAFQARIFWQKASCLLNDESPIVRVGFESGPRGFDDIWVEYERNGLNDQKGLPLHREHIQCKWHVSPDSYGYAHLVDPEFINANARSLLQRARAAQQSHAPNGEGARFRLITNWRIDRQDPLRALVHERSHTLRLDRLYGTKTDNSAMGQLRKLWREHLELDDEQLGLLARTLAFSEVSQSLEQLREELNLHFRVAGLRRIPLSESAFVYDDVVFQWMGQGRLEFDRASFRAACDREGLMAGSSEEAPRVYGVKSFEHATDRLEDRCTAVLNLVPNFAERQIRPEADWETLLYPELKGFLLDAARSGDRLRLIIDAHLTLAFAAGSVLDIKSGRSIELEQRILGKKLWAADDTKPDPSWPSWAYDTKEMNSGGSELAVAIGLTHDIKFAVESYIGKALPKVKALLSAQPGTGPSAQSVICGRHAFDLAETLTAKVRAEREGLGLDNRVHLFLASPGGFAFFFGQRHVAIGPLTLYEFDFEGGKNGSYEASLSLPLGRKS